MHVVAIKLNWNSTNVTTIDLFTLIPKLTQAAHVEFRRAGIICVFKSREQRENWTHTNKTRYTVCLCYNYKPLSVQQLFLRRTTTLYTHDYIMIASPLSDAW